MQLYKLKEEFEELMLMTDEDWVLPDDVLERLDKSKLDLKEKTQNICTIINGYDNDIDNLDKEIARLSAYKKSVTWNKDRLKKYLQFNLESIGCKTLEAWTFRLWFRKSESVEVDWDILLEDRFMSVKTTISPNKTAIKEALKDWEVIKGARLVTKENLQIK